MTRLAKQAEDRRLEAEPMMRMPSPRPALGLAAVLVIALSGTLFAAFAQDVLTGRARVLDGDTVEIKGQRVRLHGIDAPESAQKCMDGAGRPYRCGEVATKALAALIGRGPVACRILDRGRYGRLIAVCYRNQVDLNASMVAAGHALAYRQYGTPYVPYENAARARRLGVWQGRFETPWDWRRSKGVGTSRAPAPRQGSDCAIKGNVSSSGERIYHVPGQTFYDRTRISEAKGERWFCSEAEARAAGWRRARR